MIDIFLVPIALLIVLVMIHAWFGIRILERGIIFTDLAIGQLAALGASISFGFFHGEFLYLWTILFALLGALFIAYGAHRRIHLEAYIGLLYVLGASGIMMVLAQSAEGMEHFKSLLANDILFTSEEDLYKSSGIYAAIALVIYFLYPKMTGFVKELLFFSLLAVTVTSSVQLAGVFVVFTLLIAPAMVASMRGLRPARTRHPLSILAPPEILTEADLVITLRDGRIAGVRDRLARVAQTSRS